MITGPSSADHCTTSAFLRTHPLVLHCYESWWVSQKTTVKCPYSRVCDKLLTERLLVNLFPKINFTGIQRDYNKTWLALVTLWGLFYWEWILVCLPHVTQCSLETCFHMSRDLWWLALGCLRQEHKHERKMIVSWDLVYVWCSMTSSWIQSWDNIIMWITYLQPT